MTNVIIFDLDSTLADTTHRAHHMPTPENGRTWWDYAELCHLDDPIPGALWLAKVLGSTHHTTILTLRPDVARHQTMDWLDFHYVDYHELIMLPRHVYDRSNGSHAYLMDWKARQVKAIQQKGAHVVLAVDDSLHAERTYASVGVPCLTVLSPGLRKMAEGDHAHAQGV